MPNETKPLPEITNTALAFLQATVTQQVENIAKQTLAAMGLSAADGWRVDTQAGHVTRQVPDTPPDVSSD